MNKLKKIGLYILAIIFFPVTIVLAINAVVAAMSSLIVALIVTIVSFGLIDFDRVFNDTFDSMWLPSRIKRRFSKIIKDQ